MAVADRFVRFRTPKVYISSSRSVRAMHLAQWGAELHGWQVFEQASFFAKQIGL